ncbi:MAG: DUF4159 domain-containing protein [Acidobacteriaceae bacterium]|nr:DUF4159 domain-containing protein [Acidobacteriaceae bacterium]
MFSYLPDFSQAGKWSRWYPRVEGVRLKWQSALLLAGGVLTFLCTAYALDRTLPKPFRELPGIEYRLGSVPLPPDYGEKTEWAFARLMFPPGWNNGYEGRDNPAWWEGTSLWSQDFPRADRHFSQAVRRLTRISTRSVEQLVNLDEGDDVYNWPWLYAVQVGEWGLTDGQAKKLRDYLLRGGFFMADDLHGTVEWQVFEESMKRVFPDRPIMDIPNNDAAFHTVYDLDDRYQIVGASHLGEGHKLDGYVPRWRGIYDDKGRLMVAISFNSDIGDAWEWADEPAYPERYSALAVRLGVNYIVYAMTH